MSWFLFAISGYFLYSLASVGDKFLLRQRATTNPIVFTFYVGILSIFVLFLAPFGLQWPGLSQFLVVLFSGAFFIIYMLFMYKALDINDASRVFPAIGAITPILIFIFSYLFLGERLGYLQIIAFLLLVVGGFMISVRSLRHGASHLLKGEKFILLASLFWALTLVLTKYVFLHQNFVSGFVWARVGSFLFVLSFLAIPRLRRLIFQSNRQSTGGLGALLVSNKIMAGAGSAMVYFAISIASATLVNALQGVQYAFLFGLTLLFSEKFPEVLEEKITGRILVQKIIAILLIGGGLVILAF